MFNHYTNRVGAELGGPIDVRLEAFKTSLWNEEKITNIVRTLNGEAVSLQVKGEKFKEIYPLAVEKFKAMENEKFSKKALLFTFAKKDSGSLISLLPLELIAHITILQKFLIAQPLSVEKFVENQKAINWLNYVDPIRREKVKEGVKKDEEYRNARLKTFLDIEDAKLAVFFNQRSQQKSCQIQ